MATIPQSRIYGAPAPGLQIIRQPRAEVEDPGATALRQVAKNLDEVRIRVQEEDDKAALSRADFNARLALDSKYRELKNADIPPDQIETQYNQAVQEILKREGAGLRSRTAQRAWSLQSADLTSRSIIAGRELRDTRQIEKVRSDNRLNLDSYVRVLTDPASSEESRKAAEDGLASFRANRPFAFSTEEHTQLVLAADNKIREYKDNTERAARINTVVDDLISKETPFSEGLSALSKITNPAERAEAEDVYAKRYKLFESGRTIALADAADKIENSIYVNGKSIEQARRDNQEAVALIEKYNPTYFIDLKTTMDEQAVARARRGEFWLSLSQKRAADRIQTAIAEDPALSMNISALQGHEAWHKLDPALRASMTVDARKAATDPATAAANASQTDGLYRTLLRYAQQMSPNLVEKARGYKRERTQAVTAALWRRAVTLTQEGKTDLTPQEVNDMLSVILSASDPADAGYTDMPAGISSRGILTYFIDTGNLVMQKILLEAGEGNMEAGFNILQNKYRATTPAEFIAKSMSDLRPLSPGSRVEQWVSGSDGVPARVPVPPPKASPAATFMTPATAPPARSGPPQFIPGQGFR
jgi:hypothetical protein